MTAVKGAKWMHAGRSFQENAMSGALTDARAGVAPPTDSIARPPKEM